MWRRSQDDGRPWLTLPQVAAKCELIIVAVPTPYVAVTLCEAARPGACIAMPHSLKDRRNHTDLIDLIVTPHPPLLCAPLPPLLPAAQIAEQLRDASIIVSCTKGILNDTLGTGVAPAADAAAGGGC